MSVKSAYVNDPSGRCHTAWPRVGSDLPSIVCHPATGVVQRVSISDLGSSGLKQKRSMVLKSLGAPFAPTKTRAVTVRPWSVSESSNEPASTPAHETVGTNSIVGQIKTASLRY